MPELFDKLQLGSKTARNRIVRAATTESLCTKEGCPSKRMIDFYRELAEGGAGTIITGYAYVTPDGKPSDRSLNLTDDAAEAEFRALVDGVHGEGALVMAQLAYGGSKSKLAASDPRLTGPIEPEAPVADDLDEGELEEAPEPVPNTIILGPSAVRHPATGLVPMPASAADLMCLCTAFADAAARAKAYGFDGVEVHAAHGYLLSQFLDGRFNTREDEYGGTLENRARLVLGCVRAIRAKVGNEFPVLVKLNSCDVYGDALGERGGMTEDESLQVATWLAEAGATCIEISGDWRAAEPGELGGEPFFGAFATRVAAKLDIPIICTGGWRDPATMNRYLQTTPIAAVGLARPLICDPSIPNRWQEGDERATECVSCNFCSKPGIPCIQRRGR